MIKKFQFEAVRLSLLLIVFYILILNSSLIGIDAELMAWTKPKYVNPTLTPNGAIQIVKARLTAESKPKRTIHKYYVNQPCSHQRAAYDHSCKPCTGGSRSYCRKEMRTKTVITPGRCKFPPSINNARWAAEYNGYKQTWEIISFDYGTGRNYYTVHDRQRTVLSGYCIFNE